MEIEKRVDESILRKLGLTSFEFDIKAADLRSIHYEMRKEYNTFFRSISTLDLLNLAADEMNTQKMVIKNRESLAQEGQSHAQSTLNRDTYGRANSYFTITSPEYIRQLFEKDYEDDDEEGQQELHQQIESITSFINTVERHLAQGFLDRSSMQTVQSRKEYYTDQKIPGTNQAKERNHVHCLFKEYNNDPANNIGLMDAAPCPNVKAIGGPLWEHVFELSKHTDITQDDLQQMYEVIFRPQPLMYTEDVDTCKQLDLQVLFREIFSTKELGKEQASTKSKIADIMIQQKTLSKEVGQKVKKDYYDFLKYPVISDSPIVNSIRESGSYPWIMPKEKRKEMFIEEFKHKNDIDTVTFIQNYTLLSSLVKEGGLTYKNNAVEDEDAEDPDYDIACTNEVDLDRAKEEILKDEKYAVMQVNISRSPKLLFAEYIENSKKKFLGQYFDDNKINKELFWENPELQLDFEKLATVLITERNMFYSVAWANFMEGLINHHMEEEIIPAVERDVCQKMLQPALKMLYYIKKFDCLQESKEIELKDREIPEPVKKLLKEFDDLYVTANGEEQDKRLQKFVDQAENYIEKFYIPSLVMMLMESMKNYNYLAIKVIEGLGPLFYYIDPELETNDDDEEEEESEVEEPEVDLKTNATNINTHEKIKTKIPHCDEVRMLCDKNFEKFNSDLMRKFKEKNIENSEELIRIASSNGKKSDYDAYSPELVFEFMEILSSTVQEHGTNIQETMKCITDLCLEDAAELMTKQTLSEVSPEAVVEKIEQEKVKAEVREKLAKERKQKIRKEDDSIDTGFHTFRRIFILGIENKWI